MSQEENLPSFPGKTFQGSMRPIIVRLLYHLFIALLLGAAAATCFFVSNEQIRNIEFSALSGLTYEEAVKEIRRHSGNTIVAVFDGERVNAPCTGLPPGVSHGPSPRFVNVGNSRINLYRGDNNVWYILGRVKVLYEEDGQWVEAGVVENARYVARGVE